MSAASNHPVFLPPDDLEIKIWRYMDLSKFVSLLESKALFFSRADLLGDPYEGATSHLNRTLWQTVYGDAFPLSILEDNAAHVVWERQWTFANCWHMNEHESAAMWRLYARTNDAVAIQSTYTRLYRALPDNTFVGTVNYMDYKTQWMPEGNGFYRFMCKRKSFEHERELRAMLQDLPSKPHPTEPDARSFDYISNLQGGRLIPVALPELLEAVYVAPSSQPWFLQLVTGLTTKYGLALPVLQSSLDHDPEF